MLIFNRTIYFDKVRPLFGGKLTQGQVDGQEAILSRWETEPPSKDLRHLAYALATTKHETASEMLPIEEYGKGSGMEYGKKDPETGQTYYGRGYVQLTWRDNYKRAADKLDLEGDNDLEWHAARALDPVIAAEVMFVGMEEGWFRTHKDGKPETLGRYFSDKVDDPYNAREIINGDKTKVPSWSNGVSIGNLIAGYHRDFLSALKASFIETDVGPIEEEEIVIDIKTPPGIPVRVTVNGMDFEP